MVLAFHFVLEGGVPGLDQAGTGPVEQGFQWKFAARAIGTGASHLTMPAEDDIRIALLDRKEQLLQRFDLEITWRCLGERSFEPDFYRVRMAGGALGQPPPRRDWDSHQRRDWDSHTTHWDSHGGDWDTHAEEIGTAMAG